MRKLLAILFVSLYLVSTTELSQVLKFPVLVEHYFDHRKKDPQFSSVRYLVSHYSNHLEDHPEDSDYERDRKLPFVLHNQVLTFTFLLIPPILLEMQSGQPLEEHSRAVVVGEALLEDQFVSHIWHPPLKA